MCRSLPLPRWGAHAHRSRARYCARCNVWHPVFPDDVWVYRDPAAYLPFLEPKRMFMCMAVSEPCTQPARHCPVPPGHHGTCLAAGAMPCAVAAYAALPPRHAMLLAAWPRASASSPCPPAVQLPCAASQHSFCMAWVALESGHDAQAMPCHVRSTHTLRLLTLLPASLCMRVYVRPGALHTRAGGQRGAAL